MLSKSILKYIQSLHHKKSRQQYGEFIAEGPKVVTDLLQSGKFLCNTICGYESWIMENKKLVAEVAHENIMVITDFELKKISLLQTPNEVLAVFKEKPSEEIFLEQKINLMLDDIQDPGNMGTIIRIADWFGIENIICSLDCVDCYNPKVVQASMGSLGRVNVIYTDLAEFINSNKNISVYAATLNGKNLSHLNKIDEAIIIIGNESKGIHEDLLKLATEQITISKTGKAESLNAAVAAGIILYHLLK